MPLTIILAVGVDSSVLANQRPSSESAGCRVTSVAGIREAIVQVRDGDFDLILLGCSIPIESRERMTFLIRISGSRVPVVCVADSAGGYDSFADATIRNEGDDLLPVVEKLLAARRENAPCRSTHDADVRPQSHLLGDIRTIRMLWPRKSSRLGGGTG